MVRSLEGDGCSVRRLAWSPDGKWLAGIVPCWEARQQRAVSGLIRVWDARTGRPRWALEGPRTEIADLAFSPDGLRLAAVCGDRDEVRAGAIHFWSLESGRESLVLPLPSCCLTCLTFSPDGYWLAVGCLLVSAESPTHLRGEVRLLSSGSGREQSKFDGPLGVIQSLAFSRDGQKLALRR